MFIEENPVSPKMNSYSGMNYLILKDVWSHYNLLAFLVSDRHLKKKKNFEHPSIGWYIIMGHAQDTQYRLADDDC